MPSTIKKIDKIVKNLPSPPWNRLRSIETGEAKVENIEEWTEERIDWSMERNTGIATACDAWL